MILTNFPEKQYCIFSNSVATFRSFLIVFNIFFYLFFYILPLKTIFLIVKHNKGTGGLSVNAQVKLRESHTGLLNVG